MSDTVFDNDFFQALASFFESVSNFIRTNWIFALIAASILVILIFFQQLILTFLLHAI